MRITDVNTLGEIPLLVAYIQHTIGIKKTIVLLRVGNSTIWKWKNSKISPTVAQCKKIHEVSEKLGKTPKYRDFVPKTYWDKIGEGQRSKKHSWDKESREDVLLRNYRLYVLEQCGWSQVEAAKILGCCDRSLRVWIKQYRQLGYDIPGRKEVVIPPELHRTLTDWETFRNMDHLKRKGEKRIKNVD